LLLTGSPYHQLTSVERFPTLLKPDGSGRSLANFRT
jgi:hypothetical protein